MQFQRGVLRANCIDCLDRTNVAQFALGLHALGLQLQALGLSDTPDLDTRSSIAGELMNLYEQMGNVLARQVCPLCGSWNAKRRTDVCLFPRFIERFTGAESQAACSSLARCRW